MVHCLPDSLSLGPLSGHVRQAFTKMGIRFYFSKVGGYVKINQLSISGYVVVYLINFLLRIIFI